ncbi:hypothetical protein GGE65_007081 [Skermanella aerolata]|uniref:NACHT domain-containing protein n=1 Tax=Skermanella aerolata TaxID=393310 RepID=UPI003D22DC1D
MDRRDEPGQQQEVYENWREGLARQDIVYESVAEEAVWRDLLQGWSAVARGFTLITGEPGSGKSWLLEELQNAWLSTDPSPRLGMTLPVLVRCRDLELADLASYDPSELADRLWIRAATPSPATGTSGLIFLKRPSGRIWQPLWLLDGIDELPSELMTSEFFRRLANLPGRVCVTCRTVVAQAQAGALRGCVPLSQHLELLPLTTLEQRNFLRDCFDGDIGRSETLHRRVHASSQLRELAGSPLLLTLIAEVGETTLPAARAAFYGESVAELWARRVKGTNQEGLRLYRDEVLTRLAAGMTLEQIVAPVGAFDIAIQKMGIEYSERVLLISALKACGLLRFAREKFEFLHLTFQEFYLATHLMLRPFIEVLDELWDKPRYEETLALLVALAVEQGKADEVDRALLTFVKGHFDRHRDDRRTLWRKGRSPLRLVVHVLSRAAIKAETLSLTWACLLDLMSAPSSPLLRLALASDHRSLPPILARLAVDDDASVRWIVAWNAATPAQILVRLATDDDAVVRARAVDNAAAPAEPLARRAADDNIFVRGRVAGNVATPAEILARLAVDDVANVRWRVAENAAAPAEVLARLAVDDNASVRGRVAGNAATPAEILARLAADDDANVRWRVAENAVAPAEVLARLAADDNANVRWRVAGNAAAAAEILARLAVDDVANVCGRVAGNAAAPAEILARLAADDDADVRWRVAENAAAPAEVLARLATDDDVNVRGGVAGNAAAPAEALARLAAGDDAIVRWWVAWNARTLLEDLIEPPSC